MNSRAIASISGQLRALCLVFAPAGAQDTGHESFRRSFLVVPLALQLSRDRSLSRAGGQLRPRRQPAPGLSARGRSEEHTSELQSLMRISYAVFCLKKKTNRNNEHTEIRQI